MRYFYLLFFFFNDTATTEIYTLSLHDALPISNVGIHVAAAQKHRRPLETPRIVARTPVFLRSEEHTSELQSHHDLVCRLLLEKKYDKYYRSQRKRKSKNRVAP